MSKEFEFPGTADGGHCSGCGKPNPEEHEGGYTLCCNEPACWGGPNRERGAGSCPHCDKDYYGKAEALAAFILEGDAVTLMNRVEFDPEHPYSWTKREMTMWVPPPDVIAMSPQGWQPDLVGGALGEGDLAFLLPKVPGARTGPICNKCWYAQVVSTRSPGKPHGQAPDTNIAREEKPCLKCGTHTRSRGTVLDQPQVGEGGGWRRLPEARSACARCGHLPEDHDEIGGCRECGDWASLPARNRPDPANPYPLARHTGFVTGRCPEYEPTGVGEDCKECGHYDEFHSNERTHCRTYGCDCKKHVAEARFRIGYNAHRYSDASDPARRARKDFEAENAEDALNAAYAWRDALYAGPDPQMTGRGKGHFVGLIHANDVEQVGGSKCHWCGKPAIREVPTGKGPSPVYQPTCGGSMCENEGDAVDDVVIPGKRRLAYGNFDPEATDLEISEVGKRDPFAGLSNMLGDISPEIRAKLAKVVTDPSEENWNDAHSLMLTPSMRTGTLWQNVIAVDPTFPKTGPVTTMPKDPRTGRTDWSTDPMSRSKTTTGWPRVPDSVTLMRAIRHAQGKKESVEEVALMLAEASASSSNSAGGDNDSASDMGYPDGYAGYAGSGALEKSDAGTVSTDPAFNPCPLFIEAFCRVDGRLCPFTKEDYTSCPKYYYGKTMRGPLMRISPGQEDMPRPGDEVMGGA